MAANRRGRRISLFWRLLLVFAAVLLFLNSPWFLKHLYPFPYRELIVSHSQEAGLDPLLVAAVVKQESGFDPEAVSKKGAVGLMQVMPDTGRWAAGRSGLTGFVPGQLVSPEVNLRIGCWYLHYLEGEYKGNWVLVLAAYNAGKGNVEQWLAAGTWDGTWENLDSIPFYQTRTYIKETAGAYSIYQRLYRAEVGGTPVTIQPR